MLYFCPELFFIICCFCPRSVMVGGFYLPDIQQYKIINKIITKH